MYFIKTGLLLQFLHLPNGFHIGLYDFVGSLFCGIFGNRRVFKLNATDYIMLSLLSSEWSNVLKRNRMLSDVISGMISLQGTSRVSLLMRQKDWRW